MQNAYHLNLKTQLKVFGTTVTTNMPPYPFNQTIHNPTELLATVNDAQEIIIAM